MSQLFASGGQSIGASAGLIPFRMDCLDLLAVQGTLKSPFSNTTDQEHQFFGAPLVSTSELRFQCAFSFIRDLIPVTNQ